MSTIKKYEILEKNYKDILGDLSALIQKARVSRRFNAVKLSESEIKLLHKAKEICELEINNYWNQNDSNEFLSLCITYFDIATCFDYDLNDEVNIMEVFKIIIFGYLGEHSHYVKSYLLSIKDDVNNIIIPEKWDARILYTIFNSLYFLVVKNSWKDIEKAVENINQLRKEQEKFESNFLNQVREDSQPYGSAEIVSLYHFAKSIELLGIFLIEGNPTDIENKMEYHFRIASEFAELSQNISLVLLYKYFKEFSIKLIRNTIWYNLRGVNHFISEFNKSITKRDNKSIQELLYPQKYSIIKGEIFNPAYRSIILSLPTSSGKTLIAEYKILQALNVFKQNGGWVAYVVPTKSLINQIYARFKQDLTSIGIQVEKASGAVEVDGFEYGLIDNKGDNTNFDILVTTYEKLDLLIRQGLGTTDKRPLVLTIVDEAHNIGDKNRGLHLEMLLSTIKNDCKEVNFLLLTPDIPNANQIADWLGGERGYTVNLELDWWQPNERVIGALIVNGTRKDYSISLQTLNTVKGSYVISEKIPIINDLTENKENFNSKIKIVQLTSKNISNSENPIIILAAKVDETFQIAEYLYNNSLTDIVNDEDINLLQKFVKAELGENFPLVKYLDKGIAIHSSAIPDDIRQLIELLMEKGKLNVLVATTTIAQGINFPVSAVIMGSYNYPFQGPMPSRDFWNIAGRVGRVGQHDMGWIGIASRNNNDLITISEYVKKASEDLLSQLTDLLQNVQDIPNEDFAKWLYRDERWSAVLQYISHLRKQVNDLNQFITQLEQKLQDTLGYRQISEEKKRYLFNKLNDYVSKLSLEDADRADSTGFSTITVRQMIGRLSQFSFSSSDWKKEQLFSEKDQTMKNLVGIMLNTYEIRKSLEDINFGDKVLDQNSISRLIIYWVNGDTISDIAKKLISSGDTNENIKVVSKALYRIITTSASWGISALQKMPTSGIDWVYLSENEKKRFLNIPAYIYYGVNTDEAVLMRKANVPRTIAGELGLKYKEECGDDFLNHNADMVQKWLFSKTEKDIQTIIPANSPLNASEYIKIWKRLNFIEEE
jgi:replicative superfamily II helicase